MSFDWKARAAEKRRLQAASIPPEWRLKSIPSDFTSAVEFIRKCDILTPEELHITEITDGRILQKMLTSAEVTCVEVITAFSKRAAVAQQLIGCCTEMFFDAALERAKVLDAHYKKTGKLVGPLHGFPISFKDSFNVEGVDTTVGWVGLIGKPAEKNSIGVDVLIRLGAVVYVKTNIPQSLMMSDSYNHVFGQSVNALDKRFISGGSSGGEGALVGSQGSLIGIGTDIGGSIRIPAVLQGLYGMSPTLGRVPYDSSGRTQKYIVPPVAGPITSSLSSIELYFDVLLSSEPWNIDPQILPVPWRKDLADLPQRPLKIAFIYDDGIIRPQPPIDRAVRDVAAKLIKAGHEGEMIDIPELFVLCGLRTDLIVFEWDVSSHAEGYSMWLKSVLADGGQECADLCRLVNEPLIEGMLVGTPEDILSVSERKEVRRFSFS
jgi:amidase